MQLRITMNISQIGLGLNFIASFFWAIQTIMIYHRKTQTHALREYQEELKHNIKQRGWNIFWLCLLCLGFLLQLIGSFN